MMKVFSFFSNEHFKEIKMNVNFHEFKYFISPNEIEKKNPFEFEIWKNKNK
jgi:hypothetical protein